MYVACFFMQQTTLEIQLAKFPACPACQPYCCTITGSCIFRLCCSYYPVLYHRSIFTLHVAFTANAVGLECRSRTWINVVQFLIVRHHIYVLLSLNVLISSLFNGHVFRVEILYFTFEFGSVHHYGQL